MCEVLTVPGGGEVRHHGHPSQVGQAELVADALARALAKGEVALAVLPIKVGHVLHHRHAGHLTPPCQVVQCMQGQSACQGWLSRQLRQTEVMVVRARGLWVCQVRAERFQ